MSGGPGRTVTPERPRRVEDRRRGSSEQISPPSDRVIRSQVEPRIVERRRQVRDAERTRRRRRGIVLGVLVALLAAAVGVLLSPLTDVDRIEVTGSDRLAAEVLVERSGVAIGDQLVSVDLAGVRDRLREDPWLSSATVSRRWPDAIVIEVLEEQPAAIVVAGPTAAVVSGTGRVLGFEGDEGGPMASVDVAQLPRLEVEDQGRVRLEPGDDLPDEIRSAAAVFARMSDAVRAELRVARLDAGGALSFDIEDGTVVFGPVEDVPEKLASIDSVLAQVVRDCMAGVDVREPGRPTVSRSDGCNLPAPVDAGVSGDDGDEGTDTTDTTATGPTGQGGGGA